MRFAPPLDPRTERILDAAAVRIVAFARNQPVLCIAALAAAASMLAVPPSATYADYLDLRVLGLLFCLMLCVAGLKRANLFSFIAGRLLCGQRTCRFVSLVLVVLCFVCSMFVTNDVALIALVPFTLYLFTVVRQTSCIAYVVVLQTLAANLGSMVTPIGNPQNLFLFAHFEADLTSFMLVLAPYAALSLILLVACVSVLCKPTPMKAQLDAQSSKLNIAPAAAFGLLFVLAALSVARVIPLPLALAAIAVGALVFDRGAFGKVDYYLLLTFVCFFVFSGNLSCIPWMQQFLSQLMEQAPFAAGLLTSQIISNVPAAVLLAPFTADWQQLLLGVDIGGLGTPVASLASLISLELFRRARVGSTKRFLLVFAIMNAGFLAANLMLYLIIA